MFQGHKSLNLKTKTVANDYFDSGSEKQLLKDQGNPLLEQEKQLQITQIQPKFKDKYDQQLTQQDIENYKGSNLISQDFIDGILSDNENDLDKKQLKSDSQYVFFQENAFSDEEDEEYFTRNSHIFTKNILAEKSQEIKNQIVKQEINNCQSIDSISSQTFNKYNRDQNSNKFFTNTAYNYSNELSKTQLFQENNQNFNMIAQNTLLNNENNVYEKQNQINNFKDIIQNEFNQKKEQISQNIQFNTNPINQYNSLIKQKIFKQEIKSQIQTINQVNIERRKLDKKIYNQDNKQQINESEGVSNQQKNKNISKLIYLFENLDEDNEGQQQQQQVDKVLNMHIKQEIESDSKTINKQHHRQDNDFQGNINKNKIILNNLDKEQINYFSNPSLTYIKNNQNTNELYQNQSLQSLFKQQNEEIVLKDEVDSLQIQKQQEKYNTFFHNSSKDQEQEGFIGFKTANNKKSLVVDKYKMQRIQNMFDEFEEQQNETNKNDFKIEEQSINLQNEDLQLNKSVISKQTPLIDFKNTNTNQKLKINKIKLNQFERPYLQEEDDINNINKEYQCTIQNRVLKRKSYYLNEDENNSSGLDNKREFKTPFAHKKLKIDENKLFMSQSIKNYDGDKNNKENLSNKDYSIKSQFDQTSMSTIQPKKTISITKCDKSIITPKQIFNNNDNMLTTDLKNPNQNQFKLSQKQNIINSQKQQNTIDNKIEDNCFSQKLEQTVTNSTLNRNLFQTSFKQINFVDSSKSTIFNKPSYVYKKYVPYQKRPTYSYDELIKRIKSKRIQFKSIQNEQIEDNNQNLSFDFANDSDESSNVSYLNSIANNLQNLIFYFKQQSRESSLSKQLSLCNIEDVQEINFNYDRNLESIFDKIMSSSFLIDNLDDNNQKLFSSQQESLSQNRRELVKINPPKMYYYLDNPMIQMKYQLIPQIGNYNLIKFKDLKSIQNKCTYNQFGREENNMCHNNNNNSNHQKDSEIYSKDINKCILYSMICNCHNNLLKGLFHDDQSTNIFGRQIPCFCNIPIPNIQVQKDKQQSDKILQNNLNKIARGYLNYLNFYAKLQSQESKLDEKWVRTHYRQIVWKLACYENNLKECPINKKLTIENIYNELEYRLYSEVYVCKRSIIKQIQENNNIYPINMVLMINNITFNSVCDAYVIELSDGWYSFYSIISNQKQMNTNVYYSSNQNLILDLIQKNKLYIGMKLFVNSIQQPTIQNKDKIKLPFQNLLLQKNYEIFYNNIQRAPYDAKLGNILNSHITPRSLKSIRPFGGNDIQLIDVFIVKKYPLCHQKELIKQSFSHLSKLEDQEDYEEQTLGFSISVVDALSYYDSQFQLDQQPWVEVNIYNANHDLYNSLKEGERIRIYNLKIYQNGNSKQKFSLKQQRIIKNILRFETTKKTKIQLMSTFIKSEQEIYKINQFGYNLMEQYQISLEDIEKNLNNYVNDQLILQNNLINSSTYIDIIMYIVKAENGKYFGISQNYNLICITSRKDIQQNQNNLFSRKIQIDKNTNKTQDVNKLTTYNNKINKSQPQLDQKNINSNITLNLDEGKIGVFKNTYLKNIKQVQIGELYVNKYELDLTLNTHIQMFNIDRLNVETLGCTQKEKKSIQIIQEFVRIGYEQFNQLQDYIRKY